MALVFKINGPSDARDAFEKALAGSEVSIGDSNNEDEFFIIIGDKNGSDIEVEVGLKEEVVADGPEEEAKGNNTQEEALANRRPHRRKHRKGRG